MIETSKKKTCKKVKKNLPCLLIKNNFSKITTNGQKNTEKKETDQYNIGTRRNFPKVLSSANYKLTVPKKKMKIKTKQQKKGEKE